MTDDPKIIPIPTDYHPDPAAVHPNDVAEMKELLRWAIEEIVLLSRRVSTLTKALAAEQRRK